MLSKDVIRYLTDGSFDERLLEIYRDPSRLDLLRSRYLHAVQKFQEIFGAQNILIFSAPGRTEIGGNHTDHQRGRRTSISANLVDSWIKWLVPAGI